MEGDPLAEKTCNHLALKFSEAHSQKGTEKVKTITQAIFILVIATYAYPIHAGIRCENNIISIGDTSSEVILKLSRCGEVLNKEVIRKETSIETNKDKSGEKVKKEKVIELWYIRVKERGGMYCYPLTFEEGRLQSIGSWSRCN